MRSAPAYWVVIPAAGLGSRFNLQRPKQYWTVAGKTIIEHTIELFLTQSWVSRVIVAIHEHDEYFEQFKIAAHPKVTTVKGGKTRAISVMSALSHLQVCAQPLDWILVHDAVRPCLHERDLRSLRQLHDDPVGGILATQVVDTLKRVNIDNQITHTIDRFGMWQAQTPQMFRLALLTQALSNAHDSELNVTDEASAVEALGLTPRVVRSQYPNPKLTYTADLAYIASLLEHQLESAQ